MQKIVWNDFCPVDEGLKACSQTPAYGVATFDALSPGQSWMILASRG